MLEKTFPTCSLGNLPVNFNTADWVRCGSIKDPNATSRVVCITELIERPVLLYEKKKYSQGMFFCSVSSFHVIILVVFFFYFAKLTKMSCICIVCTGFKVTVCP